LALVEEEESFASCELLTMSTLTEKLPRRFVQEVIPQRITHANWEGEWLGFANLLNVGLNEGLEDEECRKGIAEQIWRVVSNQGFELDHPSVRIDLFETADCELFVDQKEFATYCRRTNVPDPEALIPDAMDFELFILPLSGIPASEGISMVQNWVNAMMIEPDSLGHLDMEYFKDYLQDFFQMVPNILFSPNFCYYFSRFPHLLTDEMIAHLTDSAMIEEQSYYVGRYYAFCAGVRKLPRLIHDDDHDDNHDEEENEEAREFFLGARDGFWVPKLHNLFPQRVRQIVLTTVLSLRPSIPQKEIIFMILKNVEFEVDESYEEASMDMDFSGLKKLLVLLDGAKMNKRAKVTV
jgi:hypothetical protein